MRQNGSVDPCYAQLPPFLCRVSESSYLPPCSQKSPPLAAESAREITTILGRFANLLDGIILAPIREKHL